MASTSSISYCTDRQLKDVYPSISEFDLKTRIYGWTTETFTSSGGTTYTYYVAYNTGKITQLFIDGKSQQSGNQTIGTTTKTQVNSSGAIISANATTIIVDSVTGIVEGSYIKINDEVIVIKNITGVTLTVGRGQLGTTASSIIDNTSVVLHFSPTDDGSNLYDENNDFLIAKLAVNPENSLVEAGDDWATIKTRYRKRASRMVESLLDNRLAREIMKDREGNYPEYIIRATALKAIVLLMKATDPTNELIEQFDEEFNMIIEGYRSGAIVLPTNSSGDARKGVLREVLVSGALRIAELGGTYSGTGYDLLKVVVDTGGPIGTARFSVYSKNDDNLKVHHSVISEVIDGDYQSIGYGLYIRFAGATDADTATINDEYEIEVKGRKAENIISSVSSMRLTRR